jgi:hypothetical protein
VDNKDHSLIEDEGAGYLVSVSDLMSGLLYIFIILLIGFILTYNSNQNEPMVPEWKLDEAEKEKIYWEERYHLIANSYKDLSEKSDKLKKDFGELMSKHETLVTDHRVLKDANLVLERENREIKKLLYQHLIRIAALKKDQNILQAKIEVLESIVSIRDEEIVRFKKEIITLKKSLELFGDMSAEELSEIIKDLEWVKEYLVEYLEQLHTSSKKELLSSLSEVAREKGVTVSFDERTAIMRIPGIRFMQDVSIESDGVAGGSYKSNYQFTGFFDNKVREEVRKVGEMLMQVLPCYTGSADRSECNPRTYGSLKIILIEGHVAPDDFSSNQRSMEVSSRHSFTVYDDLLNGTKELRTLFNRDQEPVFSISGYGASRPFTNIKGNMQHDDNRRVDLRFIMSTPMIPIEIINQLKKIGVPVNE